MCAIDIAVATARFQSPIHAQTLVGPVGEAQLKPLDWSFQSRLEAYSVAEERLQSIN